MTFPIFIADSILTRYLRVGVANLDGADISDEPVGFAIVETARLASLPAHTIHPDVGVVVRDRGVVALQSAVRADELDTPTVWVRTTGPTAELLARATLGQYFGFRPRAWVDTADAGAEAVVCDEDAAIAPLESGHREDLARAWFVLTGLPFVSHVLAIPQDAEAAEVERVAEWVGGGAGLSGDQRRAVREAIAAETGATLDDLATLMTGIRWQLGTDERRSISEFFARAGVAGQIGPIRWYRTQDRPEG